MKEFFGPLLSRSVRYDRGVGYFTSGWLKANTQGILSFASKGGKARWITSPILDERDWKALIRGDEAKHNLVLRSAMERSIEELKRDLQTDALSALAWLIADEVLDFRLAVPRSELTGEFHDKFGIFYDERGDAVSFNGSYNDSIQGLRNYESLKVFFSWEEHGSVLVKADVERFERLWRNEDPNVRVFRIPEAAREKIVQLRMAARPYPAPHTVKDPPLATTLGIPEGLQVRDYQLRAIQAWLQRKGRGIFKMATGTGKTITALILALKLRELLVRNGQSLAIVVVCPYKHLVSQWTQAARKFGFAPLKCFEAKAIWFDEFSASISALNSAATDHVMAITTNATFRSVAFQESLESISTRVLLVVDEVHNLGSTGLLQALPAKAEYRLGLSATPERSFDEEGTSKLLEYFGGPEPVFQFGLKEALEAGFLTPYEYHPVLVSLHPDEHEEYLKLSKAIAQRLAGRDVGELDDEKLQTLLLARARLLATAREKIPALKALMRDRVQTTHNLFYCGDGSVEHEADEQEVRQVEAVTRMLGVELGMHVATYTAETYLEERDQLRRDFARGTIQGLVAIRCLDEGVDIPETRQAFILASSTNPRQFIQRRGRVLRRAPGKDKAEIWDFIVLPPQDEQLPPGQFNLERNLVRRELSRVFEFAELALNGPQVHHQLRDVKKQYNLLDI